MTTPEEQHLKEQVDEAGMLGCITSQIAAMADVPDDSIEITLTPPADSGMSQHDFSKHAHDELHDVSMHLEAMLASLEYILQMIQLQADQPERHTLEALVPQIKMVAVNGLQGVHPDKLASAAIEASDMPEPLKALLRAMGLL